MQVRKQQLGAGALGQPRGMVWGGRREGGSGWGTHVYLWQIHFDIWQNQYNIVKLNKIKKKKKKNLPTNTRDTGLIPGQGTKVPRVTGQLSLSTTREPYGL